MESVGTDNPTPKARPRGSWWPACVVVVLYLAVAAGAAVWLGSRARASRLPHYESSQRGAVCLAVVEAVSLAVAVPLLSAAAASAGGWVARALRVAVPAVLLCATTLVVHAVVGRGATTAGDLIGPHLFLLSFAAVLWALWTCAWRAGLRPTTAQLVATAVGLAMVGNVFYANPLVEATGTPAARSAVIQTTLWTNPWLIAGGSILHADPLRAERLYAWSVIPYYSFRYPCASIGGAAGRAAAASWAYAAVAALLALLASLAARLRRPRRAGG